MWLTSPLAIGLSVLASSVSSETKRLPSTQKAREDSYSWMHAYISTLGLSVILFTISIVIAAKAQLTHPSRFEEDAEEIPVYTKMETNKSFGSSLVMARAQDLVRRSSDAIIDGISKVDKRVKRVLAPDPEDASLNEDIISVNA